MWSGEIRRVARGFLEESDMCFDIGRDLKPWTNTVVYKVVRTRKLRSGRRVFKSPQKTSYSIDYDVGVKHHIIPGATTYNDYGYKKESRAGIYVLKSLKAARQYAKEAGLNVFEYKLAVIQLRVDPSDFLHRSDGTEPEYRSTATYRAVRRTDQVFDIERGSFKS